MGLGPVQKEEGWGWGPVPLEKHYLPAILLAGDKDHHQWCFMFLPCQVPHQKWSRPMAIKICWNLHP